MKEQFQWVKWFGELAESVRQGRRKGLVARAKKVDWAGAKCAVLAEGDEKADPLTFFYHLASVAGGKREKRRTIYSSVAEAFQIEADLDYTVKDRFILPGAPSFKVKFNDTGADPALLWRMFDQACTFEATSSHASIAATFAKVLQINGVGIPKLTQVLFLINPKAFQPFDKAAVLPLGAGKHHKPPDGMSWAEYLDEMGRIRAAFPGCQGYEINIIGYLWTSDHLPRAGRKWYQISTTRDRWPGFVENNWVHNGEQVDTRLTKGETPPGPGQQCSLGEPSPGDVVLVRSGQEGRGIGIVYRNDYSEQPDSDGRIHVLWVNKQQAQLASSMPAARFSRVGHASHGAFAKSAAYSATINLLPSPNLPVPTAVHELNQILYGPPGTGKTYSSTTRALAVVKGIRVDEVTEDHHKEFGSLRFSPEDGTGQIEMVTFHQNYSYEDFVEGIRPRLGKSGDIGYELRPGTFRRIVEAARAEPDYPYVLIIDEINRGNVPKILGELITLIEPSRRLDEKEETKVTLPYSGTTFGVPGNLYIIGTMNTADRSILPLDTALRRRFVHVEMMPDPDHALIADSVAGIDLRGMLRAINARVSLLLDRERQIGHTYLFGVNDVKALADKFQTAILPLLVEYFYDDWSKIRHVLGGAAFVVAKQDKAHLSGLVNEGLLDPGSTLYDVLPAGAKEWQDPAEYGRIYGGSAPVGGSQAQQGNPDSGDDQD